ncbi:MAG: GNAT family N-acetyltransferase [Bacteroidota bacterium]
MVKLESPRVLLRPLEASDWEHLLPFALNEPETWQYSLISAAGEEGLKNYIRLALGAKETGKEFPFIVFDKQTQRYAGSTRFYDIQPENKSLQLGYTWYGKDFRGTGLNRHCKFLLLEHAFETLNMERVEFRADNENKHSIAAMKSIGCTVEGVLRHNGLKPDGSWRDSIVLSILREEWFASVKEKLIGTLRLC